MIRVIGCRFFTPLAECDLAANVLQHALSALGPQFVAQPAQSLLHHLVVTRVIAASHQAANPFDDLALLIGRSGRVESGDSSGSDGGSDKDGRPAHPRSRENDDRAAPEKE